MLKLNLKHCLTQSYPGCDTLELSNWKLKLSLSAHTSKHNSTKNVTLTSTPYPVSFNLSLDPLFCHPSFFIPFVMATFPSYQHLKVTPCYHLLGGHHMAVAVPTRLLDKDNLIAAPIILPLEWMESPPTFCANTETTEDLSNPKIVQSYILAPYHCHNAMASYKLEIPTRTECLQDSPYHHMDTENAYETSIIAAPTTNTTSPLYSPTQSNRMGDVSKISECSTTSY